MADSSLRQRVGVLLNLDQTIAKVDSTLDRFDGILNDFTASLETFTGALESFAPVVEKVDHVGDELVEIVARLDRVTERMDRLVDGLETLGSPLRVPDQVRKLGGRLTGRESDAAARGRRLGAGIASRGRAVRRWRRLLGVAACVAIAPGSRWRSGRRTRQLPRHPATPSTQAPALPGSKAGAAAQRA